MKRKVSGAWTSEVGHGQGLHHRHATASAGSGGQLVYQTPAAKTRSQTVDLSLFTDAQPGEVAEAILCPPHKVKPQNKLPAVSPARKPRE